MPHVSAADDPLLDRLIFGYDGTNYRVVKCDTSGNLVAALLAGSTIEVTQDTPADLKATVDVAAGQSIAVTQATAANLNATATLAADQNVQARAYGWIAAAWQAQPLQLGYSAQVAVNAGGTATAATYTFNSTAVPAGEFHVVDLISAQNNTRAPAAIFFDFLPTAGWSMRMKIASTPALATPLLLNGPIILAAGDRLSVNLTGCVSGDTIWAGILGRRVDIDQ